MFVLACGDLGREARSARLVVLATGEHIDMLRLSPADVALLAQQAARTPGLSRMSMPSGLRSRGPTGRRIGCIGMGPCRATSAGFAKVAQGPCSIVDFSVMHGRQIVFIT
eukprot:5526412-Pyramimonas_sp.AAC.1